MGSSLETGRVGHFDKNEVMSHLSVQERANLGFGQEDGLFLWHPLVQVFVAKNAISKVVVASETQGAGLYRLFKRYLPEEDSPEGAFFCKPYVVLIDTERADVIKDLIQLSHALRVQALNGNYQEIIDSLDEMTKGLGVSAVSERFEHRSF